MKKSEEVTPKSVKRAINSAVWPRSIYRRFLGDESRHVADEIFFSIKKNHTRKQTIRIINDMTLDDIEGFVVRWKLERSVNE